MELQPFSYTPIGHAVDLRVNHPSGILGAVKATRKKPQFILAMDASYFQGLAAISFPNNGINSYPILNFLYEVQPHIAIREREALENNPHYRQLIVYWIVKYYGDGYADGKPRYAVYRRTGSGGEAKLHNKYSLGYGGHGDAADCIYDDESTLDLHATLMAGAQRERGEELRAVNPEHQELLDRTAFTYANKFIVSDRGVDNVHVAVIIELVLPRQIAITSKGTPSEAEHEDAGALTAEEALALPGEMESWSKLYLESELAAMQ